MSRAAALVPQGSLLSSQWGERQAVQAGRGRHGSPTFCLWAAWAWRGGERCLSPLQPVQSLSQRDVPRRYVRMSQSNTRREDNQLYCSQAMLQTQ
eukprot:gene11256-biopygen9025